MSESVKVAVRCRPMSQGELQQRCKNVITIDPLAKTCTLDNPNNGGGGKVYQFDAAFGPESSTESVYEAVGSVVVEAVLEGYNGTVFAYGQTGCGKSFTMHGFIERTLEHLFEATSTSSQETRYLALLSYLEIYNERLRDLLQDSGAEGLLQLKEDPSRGTYVSGGLREVTVKNAAECARLVEQGDRRRVAEATKMNLASSRSHAVLTLSLEAIAINENDKRGSAVRRGRLHLVDLAGSERQSRTGATGDRLKEAASINLSLSALGNVISALAAGNGRHIPYRDSKLTRLLSDSLGGNARTLMIACVSPSDIDGDETLSTLRYAARARCIKNKPVVNEDPKDALLRQYQLELQRLRKLLETSDNPRLGPSLSEEQELGEEGIDNKNTDEVERLKKECETSHLSAQKLKDELTALRCRYEPGDENKETNYLNLEQREDKKEMDPLLERQRRKREAARLEVLKRLEKLTIGGEARGDGELRRRRERRRKRLEVLATALEADSEEGTGGVFQVYGQLKTAEEALKRMARKARQLEADAADLQASWDAERRELLRRELLATQLCDAMIPHLRPGCPFRDLAAIRVAATWCDELNRWRLPDLSSVSLRISLPPPPQSRDLVTNGFEPASKSDHNNNNSNNNNNKIGGNDEDGSSADEGGENDSKAPRWKDIADAYFRRNRIEELLAHAREAKTFDSGGRISKSGGSEDLSPIMGGNSHAQLSALNLQTSTSATSENNYPIQTQRLPIGRPTGWLIDENAGKSTTYSSVSTLKKNPPRILEALPSYPLGNSFTLPSHLKDRTSQEDVPC
ncbi:osmotic avoidance abnormal protein 3-like [Belonocnema kinseyi]|uniref:osmotic avoidance abnormal protein 3-like n=1 Tax=Belonocnema kinseyi TaxID=2817044 RepID=UPI00143D40E5|nr:osmotic avoidance abnormal protein 3-like [Belonocnema kinseyi]